MPAFRRSVLVPPFVCETMFHVCGTERTAAGEKDASLGGEVDVPLAALVSSISSSGCASPLLGLIRLMDPLLLIDFLIINSVCPSISLRRQISPCRAEVLLWYLSASGFRRAFIDHIDEKPRGEFEGNCCVTGYVMRNLRHRLQMNTCVCLHACA